MISLMISRRPGKLAEKNLKFSKIQNFQILLLLQNLQFEGIAERKTILFLGHTYHYFFSMSGFLTFIFKRLEVPSSAPLGLLYF